jgi:hypothetical protein
MRNVFIALAALAAVGIAMPVTSPAEAALTKKVIIKNGHHDRWLHRGWDRHHGKKVVVIKHGRHHDRY